MWKIFYYTIRRIISHTNMVMVIFSEDWFNISPIFWWIRRSKIGAYNKSITLMLQSAVIINSGCSSVRNRISSRPFDFFPMKTKLPIDTTASCFFSILRRCQIKYFYITTDTLLSQLKILCIFPATVWTREKGCIFTFFHKSFGIYRRFTIKFMW